MLGFRLMTFLFFFGSHVFLAGSLLELVSIKLNESQFSFVECWRLSTPPVGPVVADMASNFRNNLFRRDTRGHGCVSTVGLLSFLEARHALGFWTLARWGFIPTG